MVTILFPLILSNVTKEKKTTIKTTNFDDLFSKLFTKYGEPLKKMIFNESMGINRFINIYLNGIIISSENISTIKLGDKDVVAFLIIITGG